MQDTKNPTAQSGQASDGERIASAKAATLERW
jgi:hypothetical protein